jgi:hypothetical protein
MEVYNMLLCRRINGGQIQYVSKLYDNVRAAKRAFAFYKEESVKKMIGFIQAEQKLSNEKKPIDGFPNQYEFYYLCTGDDCENELMMEVSKQTIENVF